VRQRGDLAGTGSTLLAGRADGDCCPGWRLRHDGHVYEELRRRAGRRRNLQQLREDAAIYVVSHLALNRPGRVQRRLQVWKTCAVIFPTPGRIGPSGDSRNHGPKPASCLPHRPPGRRCGGARSSRGGSDRHPRQYRVIQRCSPRAKRRRRETTRINGPSICP
jgi:hypothetical protein